MSNAMEGIGNCFGCVEESPQNVAQTDQSADQNAEEELLKEDEKINEQEHVEESDSDAPLTRE